jgi:hypothetical protein
MSRDVNPFIIALFFMARCLVPLLAMLAISYVLKRLGLLPEQTTPPEEAPNGTNDQDMNDNGGGIAHGTA